MLPRESEQDRGREAPHHPTKRGTQQDQPPDGAGVLPDAVSQSREEANKERGNKGKGNERRAATSPQAHKERDTPPLLQ